VRTAVKEFQIAANDGKNKEAIASLFTAAQSILAKAAAKGLLHKSNASRKISRLAAVLKNVNEGKAPPTSKVAAPTKKAAPKATAAKAKAPKKEAAPKKKAEPKKKAAAKPAKKK
jgi:ribosomal protein S20